MRKTLRKLGRLALVGAMFAASGAAWAEKKCDGLPSADELKTAMRAAAKGQGISSELGEPGSGAGGLFQGQRMWAAVVNRDGQICSAATSTDDPTLAWPGSQAIAKAKAFTANAFSHTDAGEPGVAESTDIILSTANLYPLIQPGGSLYGLNNSNPFDPKCLSTPDKPNKNQGKVCAGMITFGGGVALLKDGKIVGGLGISGDTACADHEIAKRVRDLVKLNPSPLLRDDIAYWNTAHPTCGDGTLLNGKPVP